jgi:hypothetical protein
MRNRFLFFVALLGVLVCTTSLFSGEVFGQPFLFLDGKISGTVTDASTGQPIENAKITVGISSYINQTVATNSTGQYHIEGLEGNLTGITYNVTASKIGYSTSSQNVTLRTEIDFLPPASQNFALTQSPKTTPTPTVPELSTETILLAVVVLTILSGVVYKKRKKLDVEFRKRFVADRMVLR